MCDYYKHKFIKYQNKIEKLLGGDSDKRTQFSNYVKKYLNNNTEFRKLIKNGKRKMVEWLVVKQSK